MRPLAVVTGGTKGIGRATVACFAADGFDVVTCARSTADLLKLTEEIQKCYPDSRIYAQPVDMAVRTEVAFFASFIESLGRPVDLLVNNAGLFAPGQVRNEAEGTLEKMIETNLYSAYYLTRSLVPLMIQRQKGHIFTMCSIASVTAYVNGGAYAVSKFALYGMTKLLRQELKPYGIKVTAVLPGATLTASWEGVELPPERFIKAEDVAETIRSVYHLSAGTVVEEILIRPQLGDIV